MLRAIDDVDGQAFYIRELCDALFELDTRNEYVAFYRKQGQASSYRDRANVRELVVPGKGQVALGPGAGSPGGPPGAAGRPVPSQVQHPARCTVPTVVQQRGTEYWSHPEFYVGLSGRLDQLYGRLMIPLYCRRASRVTTNSDTLGEELVRHVGCPAPSCAPSTPRPIGVSTPSATRTRSPESGRNTDCRREAGLLMVVKGHQVAGQTSHKALTPRKNVTVALEAYGRMRRQTVGAGAAAILRS